MILWFGDSEVQNGTYWAKSKVRPCAFLTSVRETLSLPFFSFYPGLLLPSSMPAVAGQVLIVSHLADPSSIIASL